MAVILGVATTVSTKSRKMFLSAKCFGRKGTAPDRREAEEVVETMKERPLLRMKRGNKSQKHSIKSFNEREGVKGKERERKGDRENVRERERAGEWEIGRQE